tara:strand:+ start:154 stop:471 length:318 start_codon:yes stop_codon:yes gene_type:complete
MFDWHINIFKDFYYYLLYTSYALFFIAFTGAVSFSPRYLIIIQTVLKYSVALFLVIRFNPLIKIGSDSKQDLKFDKQIAFHAGIFLLIILTTTDLANKNTKNTKK